MAISGARLHRIFHWIGVTLTLPFLTVAIVGMVWWIMGEFPPTVMVDTIVLVLARLAAGAVLVYAVCRAIGWVVAHAVGLPGGEGNR